MNFLLKQPLPLLTPLVKEQLKPVVEEMVKAEFDEAYKTLNAQINLGLVRAQTQASETIDLQVNKAVKELSDKVLGHLNIKL